LVIGFEIIGRPDLTRKRCKAGLRDLHVVLRGIETRSDPADDLALDNDRETALHLDEVPFGA
jgi:hypothetical protein